ncbi:MAG: glycoside hydrolase family 130 protein [Fidelibacterota bacterium]|nr:MAG: glycoside hydrolase family 130 protein [Candidatus Neomarinimicrobiota bacterium]
MKYRRKGRDLLHRWEGNPILTLDDMPFPCNSVFNGTPVKLNDEYILLLRVEGQKGYSFFALARSEDGFYFRVEKKPVFEPARKGIFEFYERRGIEDPRATYIDGAYHVMYTAVSEVGYRIALASTNDFRSFERIALVSEPGNKDGVLFPEKIAGRYVRLDRPIGLGVGSIWVSYSNDLQSWGDSSVLLSPRRGYWDSFRVGASVPPIMTEHGWLEIYHGTKMTSAGPIYRAGAALLDQNDPTKVIKRCDIPILAPRDEYERIGDVGNVVFPCGAIVEPDGHIKVYYGAADTAIAVATAKMSDLIQCMEMEKT